MEQEITEKLNILKEVRLTEVEKIEIRDSLVHFMSSHPLPLKKRVSWITRTQHKILSPYGYSSFSVGRFAIIGTLVVLVSCGSLTYASASALPGEFLYPIKINIKENIEGTFKKDSEEKLSFQEERVKRRIDEINTLKKKKNLSQKEVVIAKTILKEHVDDLNKTLTTLKDTGKGDVVLATGAALIPTVKESAKNEEASMDLNEKKEIKEVITDTSGKEIPETSISPEEKTKEIPQESTVKKDTLVTEKEDSVGVSNQKNLRAELNKEVDKQIQEIEKTVKEAGDESIKEEKKAENIDLKKETLIENNTDTKKEDTNSIEKKEIKKPTE